MKTSFSLRVSKSLLMALGLTVACDNAPTTVLVSGTQPGAKEPALAPDQPNAPAVTSGDANQQNVGTPATPACQLPAKPQSTALNIQYQNLPNVSPNLQSLDVYMPAVSNPCQGVPVVIWVHGGAWMLGDKAVVDDKASLFNGLGYALVSVNYRLSPDVRTDSQLNPDRIKFPDHPNDVGAAVAWVYQNIKSMGGDPQKLALLGHSAGAHLAALVAMDQTFIQKAAPSWQGKALKCLGSYDTEAYNINEYMTTATNQQLLIYRNAFGIDANVWTTASPVNFIKEYGLAVQLARRGDADRQTQLLNFKSALESKKNTVNVIEAQPLSHEDVNRFIGMANEQIMTPAVTRFVKENCFP